MIQKENELIADDGKVLVFKESFDYGELIYTEKVYLGKNDKAENWEEYDKETIIKENKEDGEF